MDSKRGSGIEAEPRVQLLRRERVHEGPLLRIDLDHIRLPNGHPTSVECIRHPGAAAVIPLLGDGRVVLLRQYRHAVGGTILEIPAGKLDPGERPEDCARREVEEETGYRPGRLESLGSILTTPGFTDEVIWLYLAHELRPCPARPEADECLEPVLLGWDEALAAIDAGTLRDAKSVVAFLRADRKRRQRTPYPA